ncbi:MAG: type I secretion system permease/ATPase [Comamonadaceae bacterium]|uniref:type I secretion system permease/ATPase n=1 Tax=Candidatus Skiveiella danica TaxID=3386177 RepID=UPI00390A4392|nr:type I secretion system permease/ATPase [Comamonadaceae bacterium]
MSTYSYFSRSELTRALWSFRHEFLVVGLFSLIANVLMLVPTVYMLQVYDRVMVSTSQLTLLVVSLITLFLLGVLAFSEWARSRLLIRISVRLEDMLSTRVFNASFESYLNEARAHPAGALGDLLQVRQFLTGQGVFAFFDAPWTPVYIGVLFLIHPWLGVLAIAFALVQAALGWFGQRHIHAPSEVASESLNKAQSFLYSKLRNAEVVEAMGMTGNLLRRWEARYAAYMQKNGIATATQTRIVGWSKFVRYSQQSLALGMGALLVIDGQLTVGAMIASNVLMIRALTPIDQMVSAWRNYAGVRAAFLRLERLLEDYPERDAALKRTAPLGEMQVRNLNAGARGRTEPILKNINAVFSPGTVTAVLGPSGSGKSTLSRVLVGIWPDIHGEVLLDGRPIKDWDRDELGPYIGYLPQDIELFEGTIAENIARFGEIDSEKVIAAARCTGLHEMILRFPYGYDTPVGESGGLLSGGQRQRIALARAVYGNPLMIVLDEPNANLDDAGEDALMKAVHALKNSGKTIVLVTHRPSALSMADRLLVLREGRVEAFGPRDDVLAAMRARLGDRSPAPPRPELTAGQPAPT